MLKHQKDNRTNDTAIESEFLNEAANDDLSITEYQDEGEEDYNEEMYKWLSIGILLVWVLSMIYM